MHHIRWPLLLAAIVLVGLFMPVPDMGRAGKALQDLAHVPIGAVVAWLAVGVLRARTRLGRLPLLALAFLATTAALAGIEIAQPFFGRGRSRMDLATGVLGAAAALVIVEAAVRTGRTRAPLTVFASVLLLLGALPSATRLLDIWQQRREMPMLGSFEREAEMRRWRWHEAGAARVREHATDGVHALRVDLQAGRYPRVTLPTPPPDWRGYEALAFDLHVDRAVTLILKVTDKAHDDRYEDRFHRAFDLAPGAHAITVPLSDIAAGPAARRLDLGRIAGVQLFADGLAEAVTLHLDAVRLVEARP